MVKPLDEGQERELRFALDTNARWLRRSWPNRLAFVTAWALALGAVAASVTAVAGGPWIVVGAAVALVLLAILSHMVWAPERAAEWAVRVNQPTAEEMRRGDHNRSWPG